MVASGSPRGPTSPGRGKAGPGAKAGAGGQDEQAQKQELQQAQKKIKELEKKAQDSEKARTAEEGKKKKDFESAKKKLAKEVKDKESEVKKIEKQIQKLKESISKIDKTQETARKKLKETSDKMQANIDKAEQDKRSMERQLMESQGHHKDGVSTLALLKSAQAKLSEGVGQKILLDGVQSPAGSVPPSPGPSPGPAPSSPGGDSVPDSPLERAQSGPAEQAPGGPAQELEDGDNGDSTKAQKNSFLPDDDEDDDADVDELPEWRATRALRQSVRELEALDRGLGDADESARPPPSPTPPDGGRVGALIGSAEDVADDSDSASRLRAATAEATVVELREKLAESERARQALEASARPDLEAQDLRRRLIELEAACAQSPGTQAHRSQQAAIRLRAVLDTVAAPESQRQALSGLCGQLLQPTAGDAPPPYTQGLLEQAEREARGLQQEAAAELRDLRSRNLQLQEEARAAGQPTTAAAQQRQSAEADELRTAYSQLRVELETARVARTQALAEVPVLQSQAQVAEIEAERLRGELLRCKDEVAEMRGQLERARGRDRAGLTRPTSPHSGQPRTTPLAPDELTRSLRKSPLSPLGPGAGWPISPQFESPPYPEMRTLVAEAEAAAEGLRDTLRQRSEEVELVKARLLRRGHQASELQAGLDYGGDAGPLGRLVALADSEKAFLEAQQEQERTEPQAVPARKGGRSSAEVRQTTGADRAFADLTTLLASTSKTPPPPSGSPAHAARAWSEQADGVASLPWSPTSPSSVPSATREH